MPLPRRESLSSPTPSVAHEACWAKTRSDGRPGINVRDHCLNVGCMAAALLEQLPIRLRALLPAGVSTLAAMHDIGKISPGFQAKCEAWLVREKLKDRAISDAWIVRESDHAKVSQQTVQTLLQASRLYRWAAVIGAHHGRIKGERVQPSEPWWEDERRRLAEELIGRFGPLPEKTPEEAVIWFVAGLVAVADWLGSNEDRFSQDARWEFTERQQQADAALAAIGWRRAEFLPQLTFDLLFPTFDANALQTSAVRNIREPGVYIIEGPMGCGKTEAALATAYQLIASGKATGFYFALPTQITSNRIHLRVQQFLKRAAAEQTDLRLAHSASWLIESTPPPLLRPTNSDGEAHSHILASRSWFASAKRALLAPFGVGTVDQALLGIVAAKHFFVRQFGLAGKVVILDEVHSYDLYTGTLVDALIRRLRELHCTVIILSATLTHARRRRLLQLDDSQPLSNAYPLVSGRGESLIQVPSEPSQGKTIAVDFREPSTTVEECLERARQGECVLWIRNTVDDAQETWRDLKAASREGGAPIALLHSRFPFFRREQLETYWMEGLGKDFARRPSGCVLVATQVAEQSVDIDADLLITDLAPTDMLLQRLGRLWRHDRPDRPGHPEVWILDVPLSDDALRRATEKEVRAAFGKTARIYAPYVLLRSLQQWRAREAITLPAEIRAILESTYADPAADEPESWRELREDLDRHKRKLESHALSTTQVWSNPALMDREGVQTRYSTYPTAQLVLVNEITSIDSQSVRIALLDGTTVTAHDRDWDFAAAKAIYRNCVPVPRWTITSALEKPPGWLSNHVSQPAAAGRLHPDGRIRWYGDDTETGLSYHADQGIVIQPECRRRVEEEEFDESYD
ncbi:MAG: CRISPR-associated helicase Cas3' [Planctomycetes bacterium]|nr:CRISPR-associated helicase Cas3' [Planctomycetota bacterium]